MNLKASLDRLNAFFTKHPARFFLLAAVVWVALMCFLNYKDGANFQWHDILVEANGMAFDLLVFGVLLSIYEALREKRERIERLHEEIDDYRGWDEKEAMYRIVGAVKRLNKEKISKIDLNQCFLTGANLIGANLAEANLAGANLTEANLVGVNLSRANLKWANLKGANLTGVDIRGADLTEADLTGVNFAKLDYEGLIRMAAVNKQAVGQTVDKEKVFTSVSDKWADSMVKNVVGTLVGKDWFENLNKWKVEGREAIQQNYQIIGELLLITPPNNQT